MGGAGLAPGQVPDPGPLLASHVRVVPDLHVGQDAGTGVSHHHRHRVYRGVGLEVAEVEAATHANTRHLVKQDLVPDGASEDVQEAALLLRSQPPLGLGQRRPLERQGHHGLWRLDVVNEAEYDGPGGRAAEGLVVTNPEILRA